MVSPGENDNPIEEIEEGEIADASNDGFDDNGEENLPTLQRKASLNDLAASRYWNEAGRREDSPRFMDQGQTGGQWRREGLHYTTSNGSYNPDLYKLAWAQAVQSKPANSNNSNYNNSAKYKDENLKSARGVSRSENPRNGRKFGTSKNDDCINISSSSSDSIDSDDSVRVIRTLPPNSSGNGESSKKESCAGSGESAKKEMGTGTFCDNDKKMEVTGDGDDDEKEEGELEEGEIEVGSDNSGDAVVGRRYDNKAESVGTSKQGLNLDRGSARHPIGLKRGSDEKHGSKDQEREKMVAAIGQMLKNVTVKDAQKSFIGVCDQLRKALEYLIRMNTEVHANNVSAIVRQIFSGIRATYAVYKTGSPKQQEQEKSAFPRLLEFVSTKARKHFTNKQIKELESMLGSVSSGNRSLKADTAQGEKGKQGVVAMRSTMDSTFKSEERERISHNINLITQTSSKSIDRSNNSNEITNNSRTFEPNDDTQALTLTESDSRASSNSDSRASSNSSLCVGGAGSSDGSFKLWKEDTEELNDSNLPTPTRESSPANWNQQSWRCIVESQTSRKLSIPFGRGTQEETDESAFWASEPVNAVTYYQEKFGRKTFFSNDRLPSPTPSEDNEEEEASNQGLEVSSYVDNTLPKQVTEEREMRSQGIDRNLSVLSAKDSWAPLNSDDVKLGIQTWPSVNLELPVSQSKDSMDAVELRRLMNLAAVTSRKALAKSRDPRRRVTESEFCVDLNRQPCQIESSVITKGQAEGVSLDRKHKADADLIEDCNNKRQRTHSSHHLFPNNFQVMMSGSGGWLEENTVIPSPGDWDQTLEMEVDNTGTIIRPNDLQSDYNSISDADREHSIIENGNLNKRLKTESFYQATVSVGPAYESNQHQLQSNTIDGNLSFKTQSQGEEEKAGRLEVDITDQGQQMHDSANSISTAIPSVLKDIAVNPTMLMSLLKNGQESLSTQAIQKTEQYQEKNPPSGPAGELMHTTGKEMAVNPSLLKASDLQQQVSQGLATSSKPATQLASTAGEVQKRQMKPRDPRRILPINSGCEDLKLNGTTKACAPVSREIHITSSRPAVDLTPKLTQVPSLPNIEQNFKEKLVSIAEMLGKSDMKALQALSSQLCIDKSKKETECLDLDSSKLARSSNFYEMDGKQDTGDLNMVSSSQSLTDENIGTVQSKLHPWGDLDHFLEGYSEEQRLAIHQERARRIEEQNKMFHAKKLCLVLDLDHTLLNSAKFVEVDPVHEEILRKKEEQDKERPFRHLFRFPYMGMWTKLRPGIWNFLDRASKLYELHVYTMGNKVYATEMAKVLDPTGTLFAGRVISKGDEADVDGDDRPPKSKDLDGVLGMESAVVIIDDSARVWPHHRHNLIVVERYMYFPCSRRQFGLAGQSLLEADVDERAEDGTLASSLAVIEKIHHNFFSSKLLHEVDVRDFLAAEQRKILMGCKVVFSRVFPVGEAQPHLHPLWQMAEQFGAVCTTQIDEQVTHVVALSPGTDKVNWALQTGRWVVHPGWLEASALLYRRANENHYSIIMTHYPPQ